MSAGRAHRPTTTTSRIRSRIDRTARLGQLIPLGSAAIVALLGLAMAMRGVTSLAGQ